jgi:hypothetical protein
MTTEAVHFCPSWVVKTSACLHGPETRERAVVVGLIDTVRPLLASVPLQGENPELFPYQIVGSPTRRRPSSGCCSTRAPKS